MNIDPVGNATQQETEKVVLRHFPDAWFSTPNKPSFPLAVQRLWRGVQSPYVFHLEDSKELNQDVDLERLITAMEHPKFPLGAIALRPVSHKPCHEKPKLREDGIWEVPYYRCAVVLQPTLWRADICKTLAEYMVHGVSPEKTTRSGPLSPHKEETWEYMDQFRFGFIGTQCFYKHGQRWRVQNGYDKKGRRGIPDTWQKIS